MLLAHVGLCRLHALLGDAPGGKLTTEADDAGGLAGAALGELVDELGVSLGACRCGLALLVGAPQQQAKGAEQGGAIKDLAQGGHAAAFWPQPQSACRW